MAGGRVRPSLGEHFGGTVVGNLVTKRLLGGYQVPVLPFLHAGLYVFQ